MFLLVPAYPGCPGSKAVKRSLLLLLSTTSTCANNISTSFLELLEEIWSRFLQAMCEFCSCHSTSGANKVLLYVLNNIF